MSKYGINGSYWKKDDVKEEVVKEVVRDKRVVELSKEIKKESDNFMKGCKTIVGNRYYGKKMGMKKTGSMELYWNKNAMGSFLNEKGDEVWYRKKDKLSKCEKSRRNVVKLTSELILLENNLNVESYSFNLDDRIKIYNEKKRELKENQRKRNEK